MNVINNNNINVTLNNSTSVYHANDTFSGTVDFQFIFPKAVKYIYIDLVGRCFTSLEKDTYSKNKSKTIFTGEKIVIQTRLNLLGNGNTHSVENIPAGTYTYPFSFQLPNNIPPTVNETHGFVEYFMKAVLLKGDNSAEERKVPFTVEGPPIDLRRFSDLYEPHEVQVQAQIGQLCCIMGNIVLNCSVSKRAYKPGDKIKLVIDCENGSSRNIKSINAFLQKFVTYRFGAPSNYETKKASHLHSAHYGSIEKHSEKTFSLEMTVPLNVKPVDLTNCQVMDISYSITVKANIVGPFTHPHVTIPIEIGDIVQENDVPQMAQVLGFTNGPPAYSALHEIGACKPSAPV